MPKLEYSPVALEKLDAIHRYIDPELLNPQAAANTIQAIRGKIRTLKQMPMIGAPLASRTAGIPEQFKDARVLRCGHYLVIYLYAEDAVRILRIYHDAEDYVRHLFKSHL